METDLDPKAVVAYQQKIWGYRQGELVAAMMHIGDRLDLYRSLAGAGSVTAAEFADITGLHERWLLEWLRSQAAANLVDSDDGVRFSLPPEAAVVVADRSALTYAGSALTGPRSPDTIDRVVEAFRTGVGMTYDDHGPEEAHHVEKAFGNWMEAVLVPRMVPAIDGLADKLTAGANVADVGCGAGQALRELAGEFGDGTYHGYDISEHAINLATERLGDSALPVSFHCAGSDSMGAQGPFDLVLTMDCLHDMTRPDVTAREIRSAIADDGVWVIKEIRSSSDYQANRKNPNLAMMYSTSVLVCMSSSMSEAESVGYGTLGLNPDALETLITDAGFSSITTHDFEDPVNLYYEVRP